MKKNQLSKKIWAEIVKKSWKDPAFKELLLKNPKEALKEFDVLFLTDETISIIESKEKEIILLLPPPPIKTEEITEKELENLAAGAEGMTKQSIPFWACQMGR